MRIGDFPMGGAAAVGQRRPLAARRASVVSRRAVAASLGQAERPAIGVGY